MRRPPGAVALVVGQPVDLLDVSRLLARALTQLVAD
jgi:hypothetical protein